MSGSQMIVSSISTRLLKGVASFHSGSSGFRLWKADLIVQAKSMNWPGAPLHPKVRTLYTSTMVLPGWPKSFPPRSAANSLTSLSDTGIHLNASATSFLESRMGRAGYREAHQRATWPIRNGEAGEQEGGPPWCTLCSQPWRPKSLLGRGDNASEAILPLVHDDEDPSFLSIIPNLLRSLVQMTFQAGMGVCPNSFSFLHMSSDLDTIAVRRASSSSEGWTRGSR